MPVQMLHLLIHVQRTAKRDQKVDDDDGHYIVHDHADLTERCKLPLPDKPRTVLTLSHQTRS